MEENSGTDTIHLAPNRQQLGDQPNVALFHGERHLRGQDRIRFSQLRQEHLKNNRRPLRQDILRARLDLRQHVTERLKRFVDIFVSGTALLVLSPLFAALALAIKLTDRGPVFFFQSRVGRHGHIFSFPKFRSMVVDAEQRKDALLKENQHGSTAVTFKMKRDPRITSVGAIMRRFSMDELPQLWCVLTGEMTLVGPRPAVPRETSIYSSADRRRLCATPGLTCIWQVSGRADISFPEQVEMDWNYIHSQTIWQDIVLLLKTIPAVIHGKGAY